MSDFAREESMDKKLKIAIIVVIVLFALGVIKDQIVKSVVAIAACDITGAPVKIGGLSIGIFKQRVRIKDFKIYNPKGFPKETLLDMPAIRVDYDVFQLFKGKLHLPLVAVDLKEMVITKNKERKLNVDELKFAQPKKETLKPAETMPMQIDKASLNIGRVIFKDYSKGADPSIQVYEVAVKDKNFTNIASAQQLIALVLVEAMKPTAIKSAGIYAAATILGVGLMPAGVVGMFVGKDNAAAEYSAGKEKAYKIILEIIKKMGEIKKDEPAAGIIEARVDGSDLTIRVDRFALNKTKVTVSARKYLMPKPEIAGGILYKISEKLK